MEDSKRAEQAAVSEAAELGHQIGPWQKKGTSSLEEEASCTECGLTIKLSWSPHSKWTYRGVALTYRCPPPSNWEILESIIEAEQELASVKSQLKRAEHDVKDLSGRKSELEAHIAELKRQAKTPEEEEPCIPG